MELPATYLLALQADRRRMDSARLDAPVEVRRDRRRSIRAAFRLVTDVTARIWQRQDADRSPAKATCPGRTPNAFQA